MKKIIVFLILLTNCALAQQKIPMKEALPAGGLLNKKIKQTKWYFNAERIIENKLDLSDNTDEPDLLHFVDANKFLITLRDNTTFSGTYHIFDLGELGTHKVPVNYKTFKVNKSQKLSPRGRKLTEFLEQHLNVHYDLEQKTMDFISNDVGPIVPSN